MKLVPLLLWMWHSAVQAQCGMTTYVGVTNGCHINPQVMVFTNDGTAPYTITIEKRNAITQVYSTFTTITNDADGAYLAGGDVWDWDNTDRARVTVTDATSCVATWIEILGPFVHFLPVPMVVLDCVAGTSAIQINTQLCSSGNLFSIDGGSPQNFLANWTPAGLSTWRYSGMLSPGTHFLYMQDTPCSDVGGLPTYCYEPTQIDFTLPAINPGDCGTNFNLRAALAGALPSGTVMGDQLRVAGLVPSTEPYSALGYTYTGVSPGASLQPSLLTVTGNNAIVDWVVVEMRSPTNAANIVYSRPALIQRDGDVVGLNGTSYINTPLAPGNYYVAIRHRNHLGIMTGSARPLWLDPTAATIDFRSSSLVTYGTAARVPVGSVQCMRPGDANGNGTVAYAGTGNDRDLVLQAIGGIIPTNTVSNVYDPRDVNMDGIISYTGSNNDRDVVLQAIGGTVPTAVRTQQIP